MADVDQGFASFTQGLPVEVGDAMFGDDVVDVTPACHDPCSGSDLGTDLRNTLRRERRNRDDRFAAFAPGCASDEVHLPADPRVDAATDGVADNLPSEVDFNRAIDCDHVVIAGNSEGIVHQFGRMEGKEGVVVGVVVELPCSDGKG